MVTPEIPETYEVSGVNVLNQGAVGSCVAHSISAAMGYGELKSGADTYHDFSRGFIYANRRDTDYQGEGMCVRQALKQLNHCGDCEYVDFPWNESYPKVKARLDEKKDEYLKKAEPFKVLNYFRCYTNDEVKIALLNQGAVVIGIPVYDSFEADCPIPNPDEKKKGGHAMCVVGWDKTGWIIQNSWGKTWGNKGRMHLPYDYPIDEFWGITVNNNVPQPEKKNWIEKFFSWLGALLKRIFTEGE